MAQQVRVQRQLQRKNANTKEAIGLAPVYSAFAGMLIRPGHCLRVELILI
jgi:hypothetical protein